MSRTCEPGVSNYPVDLVLKSEEAKFFLFHCLSPCPELSLNCTYLHFLIWLAGLTKNTFKSRWDGHNFDIRHSEKRTATTLSKYVWYLKDNNVPYQLHWRILDKAKCFNPVTGVCRLCLLEKYYIMYNHKDATLNQKHELYQPCNHRWQDTLKHAWGIKI